MNDEQVRRLLMAAADAQRTGQRAAARAHLEKVIALVPGQPQALNSLGILALDSGDAGRALDLLGRATAADPLAPPLWLNLAKAQRALGDDEGERSSLDRILAIDPRNFMGLLRKAELEQRLGEEARAAMSWRAVLALAPAADQRTPALHDLLERGRLYVEQRDALFEAAIAEGMGKARADLDGADLRRFDAAIDHTLGKRPIYVNVCAGLYFPFLPADEFFPRRHFPWMDAFEAAAPAIRGEFEALLRDGGDGFAPYVKLPAGSPATIWSDLDNSARWSAFYFWEYGRRYDDACARCPATAAAVEAVPQADIPGRAPTAFFSVLRPRTRIPAHTGVTNIRATVHLPLIVPPGCGFRVGGETRPWEEGKAFAFDDTIEHEAWNDSDEMRAVLIVDVWNPHISEVERALLRTYYGVADASGHNPEADADVH